MVTVRRTALVISGRQTAAAGEYVTKIIDVENVPAPMLVPVLRPLVPVQGHMAAINCSNKLVIVDTFANLARLEAIVRSLDVGEPYTPPRCDAPIAVRDDPPRPPEPAPQPARR